MKKVNNSILKSVVMTILLFMNILMVHAVNITYSLTTHVDRRTIVGTANVNAGATLENSMPRDLWRANTTYKYYSDAELTQEITVAPATDATVYVDYVFEPPFLVSSDGVEYYYYLNAYIREFGIRNQNNSNCFEFSICTAKGSGLFSKKQ